MCQTSKKHVWSPLNKPELGFMNSLSDAMAQLESKDTKAFTDIRHGPHLLVASDYAGERDIDIANSYSFLFLDAVYLWLWDEMWHKNRSHFLPDNRRFAFKKLNDKVRQKALIPFLKSVNTIPGILITYVFHKNAGYLFDREEIEWKADWKKDSFEKLLRIANLFCMMVSCLSRSHQNIIWLTDNDTIMANEEKQKQARSTVMHIINHYVKHPVSWSRFGTPNDIASEDILSICDLACGAINELAGSFFAAAGQKCNRPIFWESTVQDKAHQILEWYMDDSMHALKRITVLVWRDPDNSLRHQCMHFKGKNNPAFFWQSEFKNIMSNSLINKNISNQEKE
jgi:hypothetical protein